MQTGSVIGVTTLDNQQPPSRTDIKPRQVIGVGNVGREPEIAIYTLYNPSTDQVEFKTVYYGASKGFQV